MLAECSKPDFRKFLLSKQFLLQPRQLRGVEGIAKVFNALRAIQYDPQDVCGKNVDLVLGARVSGVSSQDYHEWLYGQRKGIEIYDKELCVVPVEDVQHARGRFPPARQAKLDGFLRENRKQLDALLEFVKEHGPTTSSDLSNKQRVDIFWEPASWSKVALDSLWKSGQLVVTMRKGNRKYYDLPSRVYGTGFQHRRSGAELRQEHILRRVAAVGALPESGTSSGWLGLGTGREINPLINVLVHSGQLVRVAVQGAKRHYVINAKDLKHLSEISCVEFQKRVSFLPPLDNLLWDREMVREVFDFDYKWEAYSPSAKREYGHYVLPVLYGTDFIGRIMPKFNASNQTLEIAGFWPEARHKWCRETQRAVDQSLREFQAFLGAKRVAWKAKKPRIFPVRRLPK